MPSLEPLMRRNFLEYASYVVVDRAIPDLRDGCKPVQRRILHTLSEMDDGKFIKVANVIGETMKLHPHGDASIGDALVVLANKGVARGNETLSYFIERQGNFGNLLTGDNAAAPRYIECRLSALAKDTLFNPALTKFNPSYDGRKDEPEALPAKLPVVLMLGTEGIAVGMATTILPHNLPELLRAEIAILKGETPKPLVPDFPQGGLMDASDYDDGRGKVKVRAKLEADGDKRIVIREIPFGTTTESMMASIESAVQKGKVKISEISDRTGSDVEIHLELARGTYAAEVLLQLYAYTECQVSINSNLTVISDRHPAEMTVTGVLARHVEYLLAIVKAELEHQLGELRDKHHHLTLEQLFIEHRIYKRIEEATTEDGVNNAVKTGMAPFAAKFVRPLSDEDVARLLEIRIKRISAYDIAKNRRDIAEVLAAINDCERKLKDLTGTCVRWIETLLAKYEKLYPRRTKVGTFQEVDKKSVANANLVVRYDATTGFLGTAVKGGDKELKVSEYDRLLIITSDGAYQIIAPPEKTVIEGKILLIEIFNEEVGFPCLVAYRDADKKAWAKRCLIKSYITGRRYELIKEGAKLEVFAKVRASGALAGKLTLDLAGEGRTKAGTVSVPCTQIEEASTTARGQKLSDKLVSKIRFEA
jgi:topoisomerase-4 subunit A